MLQTRKISMTNTEIIFFFLNFISSCVLIITGSLNPIHCSHIRNLQLVKEYLENHTTRPLHVLAAYLSPTQYVIEYKLKYSFLKS